MSELDAKEAIRAAVKSILEEKSPERMANEEERVQNGLAGALGFNAYSAFPQNQGTIWGEQISQATTVFKNLRWYLVSNFQQVLNEAYVELGLIQTLVDVPVDDAMRGGIEVTSKQLTEDQIRELIETGEDDDDFATIAQTAKWNRLFGGAGTLVLTDQDPMEPLDISAIGPNDRLDFRACDLWELVYGAQNPVGYNPTAHDVDYEYFSYYGEKVHQSRVLIMKGIQAPSFIRPRLRGWGFSVVEILVRSLNQYLKATDVGFEVLDEFKVDVFKIKNLTNTLMSQTGEEQIRRRLQLAAYEKNYQNALIMDSEDDWDHKQLSFAGLAEAMAGIRMQVASDLRMPLSKIFGISAAGFNSGEDDLEVYNAMVESQVRGKIKRPIKKMLQLKCQKLFGFVPDDLRIAFKPMRVLSDVDEQNVKNSKFDRLLRAKQANEITTVEFRDGVNKGQLLDIALDTSEDVLGQVEELQAQDAVLEGGNGKADQAGPDGGSQDDSQTSPKAVAASKPKGSPGPGMKANQPKPGTGKEPVQDKNAPKISNVAPYNRFQRAARAVNSKAFDLASYRADGGDNFMDKARLAFFTEDEAVDKALWERAEEAAYNTEGLDSRMFTVWWYKKHGGRFNAGAATA